MGNVADFDSRSGSILERLIFNNRPSVLLICLLMTLALGFQTTRIHVNASFEKMIPLHQPFIINYFAHYAELQAQGNAITVVVAANKGTIINSNYLETLQKINDEIYVLPGVDRPDMTSLWTANTRFVTVTPDGLEGGPVIGQSYDGSPEALNIVRSHIDKTGQVGRLVSNDFTSSMIYVPLMENDNITGKPLNYGQLAADFDKIRKQYASQGVTLHIVGFTMVVGDLINGTNEILAFFGISLLITTMVLFWYTRCVRSTVLVVVASLVAVIWELGLVPLLGFDLNPYSVLVPFLVFAIGMSHGAQKMNGVMQDIGRGTHPLVAARYTFRRLFLAGFAALTCDAVSFAVLMTIQIAAIRELAIIASLGVAILIFTNLIMLPILLSYTGVSQKAARRNLKDESLEGEARLSHPVWDFLDLFTRRRFAAAALLAAIVLGIGGWYIGRNVQVGDLDQGAPELRQNSQYNVDNAYIIRHYATGSDTFVVMMETKPYHCDSFEAVSDLDSLEWRLDQLPAVQSSLSLGSFAQNATKLLTEDSPKWFAIVDSQYSMDDIVPDIPTNLQNLDCNFLPVYVSLKDHKAATLTAVVKTVQAFAADPKYQNPNLKIMLAAGNAGIDAATNIVISQANKQMLYLVYAAVILFCFITFRSWRAVLCAVLPLILTSILAQALMVVLGIGVKVSTLPVDALGVGIGVDYALYVLSIMLKQMRAGATLSEAYHRTLLFTGKVVLLTGVTLAVSVGTWAFAPIKFQADMGILLSFMFVWNMLGALILLPALACFLMPQSVFKQPETKYEPHHDPSEPKIGADFAQDGGGKPPIRIPIQI
jgi:predicted RND superfamily exporter protein